MRIAELEGRRIAILGAGREGQASHAWMQRHLPGLAITLLAESPADAEFAKRIMAPDRLVIEPFNLDRLRTFDVLIRSPGVSLYRSALQRAQEAGVQITTPSNLWFAAHSDARTICITGTKGKSTTSALVHHVLTACGRASRLAGNIGLPLLACDDGPVDWWVIELSSYQIADLEATPEIAVILNLSPEHLDWHGSEETYRRDKLRLADLAVDGKLIINAQDEGLLSRFLDRPGVIWFNHPDGVHVSGKCLLYRGSELPVRVPAGLPGRHNLVNVAAALSVALAVGIDAGQAAGAIAGFEALPHRLQLLGEHNGVTYFNDSIASTPVATVAALETLQDRTVVLIVGGKDRGLDWTRHAHAFNAWPPAAVIGLPSNGPRIENELKGAGYLPARGFYQVDDLPAAVSKARSLAAEGDIVLLSPGAPSFPQFVDFRERGDKFAQLALSKPGSG